MTDSKIVEQPNLVSSVSGSSSISGLKGIAESNKSLAKSNPYKLFLDNGISKDDLDKFLTPESSKGKTVESDSGVSVDSHWWGFELKFNESYTQTIIAGTAGGTAIAAIIAGAQPELAPIAGIIGGSIALEGAVISGVDDGDGVHYDLNWVEIAEPATLAAALIPFAN